jgi:hypothetical protein
VLPAAPEAGFRRQQRVGLPESNHIDIPGRVVDQPKGEQRRAADDDQLVVPRGSRELLGDGAEKRV